MEPAPDYIVLLLAALTADMVAGGRHGIGALLPGPRRWFRALAGELNRRLNRSKRSERDRQIRGVLVVIFMLVLGIALGFAVHALAACYPYGWTLEALALFTLLSPRLVVDRLRQVARALDSGRTDTAEAALLTFAAREDDAADSHAIARRAVEAGARALYERLIGPMLWYLIAGLPALFAYVAISETAGAIAGESVRQRLFGASARSLDDAVNYLPSCVAALLVPLAALLTPTASPVRAFETVRRHATKHPSVAAGPVVAGVAGALDLALGGPRRLDGAHVETPWIGDGRARTLPADVRRTAYLYTATTLVAAGLAAAALGARFAA
jgi:adenosylcobinamide-phosphate synthase